MLTMSDLFNICCRYTALEEKFSTLNVDIVACLCNIVSPVFGAEASGMKVDSVFVSLKNGFVYCLRS
jgi:hypothetical protein